jgi:hypothetical protein
MSHSNSINAYLDVKVLFDQAVQHNGVKVKCKSNGQAVNTRARLNHLRTLDRALMAEVYSDPGDPRHGVSAYDPFVVKLIDDILIIEPRQIGGYIVTPLNEESQS